MKFASFLRKLREIHAICAKSADFSPNSAPFSVDFAALSAILDGRSVKSTPLVVPLCETLPNRNKGKTRFIS